METDPRRWTEALRASHDALVSLVVSLSPEQLSDRSYCQGWDVSQVLSHLGSGAEISLTNLERVLGQADPLGREDFGTIWGQWNALSPTDKARRAVIWDRRLVSVLEGLSDEALDGLRMPFLGMDLDAATYISLRLGEHAVHSWDLMVSFDPSSEILASSADLLVDRLGFIVDRVGKAAEAAAPRRIAVTTSAPERHFVLALADKATLSEGGGDATTASAAGGGLRLTAAAFLRLCYGRLDPAHTPSTVETSGDADLEELRRVFPGF
ncbi:MAG TPA: maleylpyruvate isomerase family mycothiol-dependent enzyme [Acidimicrobiales bacterium]|nr:maleylpyruvate isomerase family mycothiol-dependent enzyme [Acidimicrobiales bacterium]